MKNMKKGFRSPALEASMVRQRLIEAMNLSGIGISLETIAGMSFENQKELLAHLERLILPEAHGVISDVANTPTHHNSIYDGTISSGFGLDRVCA